MNLDIDIPERGRKPVPSTILIPSNIDLDIDIPERGRKLGRRVSSPAAAHEFRYRYPREGTETHHWNCWNRHYNLDIDIPERGRKLTPCFIIIWLSCLFRYRYPREGTETAIQIRYIQSH